MVIITSIPGKRRCSLSANYKFQLTISPSSSLAWSRFRWAMTRSLDGKSRLQPVDIRIITHPSIPPIRQLTTQRAYKDLRPKSTMCSENFHSLLFRAYSSGFVTLAMPGLSCWVVVVSTPRSERVTSMRNRPLTVLQGWPRLENRRKDIRDTG